MQENYSWDDVSEFTTYPVGESKKLKAAKKSDFEIFREQILKYKATVRDGSANKKEAFDSLKAEVTQNINSLRGFNPNKDNDVKEDQPPFDFLGTSPQGSEPVTATTPPSASFGPGGSKNTAPLFTPFKPNVTPADKIEESLDEIAHKRAPHPYDSHIEELFDTKTYHEPHELNALWPKTQSTDRFGVMSQFVKDTDPEKFRNDQQVMEWNGGEKCFCHLNLSRLMACRV
jgi:hypothetical protein